MSLPANEDAPWSCAQRRQRRASVQTQRPNAGAVGEAAASDDDDAVADGGRECENGVVAAAVAVGAGCRSCSDWALANDAKRIQDRAERRMLKNEASPLSHCAL